MRPVLLARGHGTWVFASVGQSLLSLWPLLKGVMVGTPRAHVGEVWSLERPWESGACWEVTRDTAFRKKKKMLFLEFTTVSVPKA